MENNGTKQILCKKCGGKFPNGELGKGNEKTGFVHVNCPILLPEYDYASIYPNHKTLSSSQALLYEKDPAKFYTKYVLGVREPSSVPMLVGSIFSALHHNRKFDFRTALAECKAPKHIPDLFARVIARFPIVPAEIAIVVKHGKWKFRATPDGLVESNCLIIENKTGETEWTQERLNFDDQITFQAWTFWKKVGVIPNRILLNWVNTKRNCRKEITTLKTTRSVKALKMFEKRIDAIVQNIEAGNWTNPIYG